MQNINPFQPMIDEIVERTCMRMRQEFTQAHAAAVADQLYSPEKACKLFNPAISKVTLKKWCDAGLIEFKKLGGRIYFKHSDIISAGSRLKRYKREA
jgi:hypothetical protein